MNAWWTRRRALLPAVLIAACTRGALPGGMDAVDVAGRFTADSVTFIRVNQLGYLPDAPKVAVACSLETVSLDEFLVLDEGGAVALGPLDTSAHDAFAGCARTHRLDFSALREPGRYRIRAGNAVSRPFTIAPDAFAGAADTLLHYMRQQRSLYNPLFRDSVHQHTDALLVDHPTRAGEFIPVAGGWADAADYLQYVTTSAHATTMMLLAFRDHPHAFADHYAADGAPGANGRADVLDEARWGLEWLLRMFPEDDLLLNQIGDDRDHAFPDLPTTDSSDYGWGRGGFRPVYPCTGRPQGLLGHTNRSTGLASTAGKIAAAFAFGAHLFAERDPAFAATLTAQARAAYDLGRRHPGVCQTAPARAPYFYEEENWVDDMELAAAALFRLTREPHYFEHGIAYADAEPVSPWMGRDTARHYEFFPWHNHAHHELWHAAADSASDPHTALSRMRDPAQRRLADYYARGLRAVADRARANGFRVGIPFIWCSNDLMASFATQAYLYRTMTGDEQFRDVEAAALDWLFGVNPWGVSMVIGLPADGHTPRDPHSIVARQLGVHTQLGGLVDGPVYRSIFENLLYVELLAADEFAPFNRGFIVYHDDWGDYSTNEPIMDGTANLTFLLGALAARPTRPDHD